MDKSIYTDAITDMDNPGQKSLGHPEKTRAKLDICEKCLA